MKSKLLALPVKYPALFERHPYNKGEDKSFFHFECNEGWYTLLDSLLHVIQHNLGRYQQVVDIRQKSFLDKGEDPAPWIVKYFEENPVDPLEHFSIQQIKEKFGGLRFYVSFGEAQGECVQHCEGAIQLAESLSFNICELCGQTGSCRSPIGGELLKTYRESLLEDNQFLGGGYIQTLCDEHHKIKDQDIIDRHKKYLEKGKHI